MNFFFLYSREVFIPICLYMSSSCHFPLWIDSAWWTRLFDFNHYINVGMTLFLDIEIATSRVDAIKRGEEKRCSRVRLSCLGIRFTRKKTRYPSIIDQTGLLPLLQQNDEHPSIFFHYHLYYIMYCDYKIQNLTTIWPLFYLFLFTLFPIYMYGNI